MKVFYLTNQPSPYRVKFWNMLGKKCDLTVVFETYVENNRSWEVDTANSSFRSVYLPGMTFRTEFHYNPSIIRHLRKNKYDIYVIGGYHSPTDMMAIKELKRQGRDFIYSADGGFPVQSENPIKRRMKLKYLGAAKWYLSSGSVCDEYLKCYGVKKEQIYRYNFSSVTRDDFEPKTRMTEARKKGLLKRYGLNENIIISVGQFIPRKGFDLLLDMWNFVNAENSSLLIVGGGPDRKLYEKMIADYDIKNVVLLDFVPKEHLMDIYRLCKGFAFPTRYDIWGLTPGEAMCCGLPVIGSLNAASIHDLVGHEYNGFVESLNDRIVWGKRMEMLLTNDRTQQLMSQRAKAKMREYTIEGMVDSYYNLFKQIIRSSSY